MTIGIGRKFGRRMVLATDTMIIDNNTGRADSIPGRLKAIILSPYVSIAYAGHADPAIFTIRRAHQSLLETGNVREAAKILIEASSRTDVDVEFILAFHEDGRPFMHKVTAQGISDDLENCFIGDAHVVRDVLQVEPSQRGQGSPDIGILVEESRFANAFHALFTDRGVQVSGSVGGVPIILNASPYGHHYQGHALSMAWDTIDFAVGITPAQHRAQRAGETAWKYNVIDGILRGVAVMGVALPQAGVGFVYSPLHNDDAEIIQVPVPDGPAFIDSTSLLEAVSARVNALREADGYGVVDLEAPWEQDDAD
tara:strand:- start:550 stop:1482 length:933 start_codon:yes stop_codon:yes gene_type:complete